MGCSQSKIENEEAVSRCKERKQFMKEAVTTRNVFAAAHSAYTMSLKNTGAALSDYGQGEILDHRTPSSLPSSQLPPPPRDPLPPPPPLPNFSSPPLQRAATMPEFSISKPDLKPTDTIEEEEDDDDIRTDESNDLSHHRRRKSTTEEEPPPLPPSPPRASPPSPPRAPPNNPTPLPPEPNNSAWEYFFPQVSDMPMPSLSEVDEIPSFKDEGVGGSNYDNNNNRLKRSENVRVDGGDIGNTSTSSSKGVLEIQNPVIEPTVVKPVKKVKQNVQSNSVIVDGKRSGKGVSNVSLLQILNDLDEQFLKASQSAYEVSKLLEANRLHYHSNFADNRGHIDHSKRVMRVITWNRSFRGLQNADDGNDEIETYDTLASVLDKLLAWEKKLYDEVKVGEVMKFEYQKKVALLNKQKNRGTSFEALEKTKAAVSHLHTRYIVDMQSLDSTVSEINNLRDDQLYPKLVSLVDGSELSEGRCLMFEELGFLFAKWVQRGEVAC
ncbi:protein of unknown function DUF632 [Macleaya cordata]|uniref:DUF632 domain-containing protein n=1 Tax=Macleaya cordata TaxID=56857 RepID=A0A200PXS1_MACCD|nr:protein of unknown function DUF632 [Macleaya cordata]